MSASNSTLGHAIPTGEGATRTDPAIPGCEHMTTTPALVRNNWSTARRQALGPKPCSRSPRAVDVALPAVTVPQRRELGVLGCVRVTVAAPPDPSSATTHVLGVGDRVQAVRVAAAQPQTGLQMIQFQACGNRATEELPDSPMDGHRVAVTTAFGDLAVPGTAYRTSPDPVPVDVLDAVEDPVDQRSTGVDPWHAATLLPARPVRVRIAREVGARNALFASHHLGLLPDPLSRAWRA